MEGRRERNILLDIVYIDILPLYMQRYVRSHTHAHTHTHTPGCSFHCMNERYKNGLMKRVFVHESMAKFIKRVAEDGQVELNIIRGINGLKRAHPWS